MATLTLGLLLLAAVVVSSVVEQLIPRVTLPLVQIVMGVVIALFATSAIRVDLDPDLFLVLFIAPLLYDEAKNTDKALLWRDRRPILALAIGLVIATALVIGFTVNLIIPSIPLAAAFALGAALGPTDAVAVTSLSKIVNIPERQKSILRGELLLNDASGIVSFQFALAAAITGTFSLIDATGVFLFEFIGGLLFGAGLGLLGNAIVRWSRSIGVENTTFHVLFEVLTPFLVYLISSAFHVSGIIAVVVAGLVNVISPRQLGPSIARMNIVSSSVWRVVSFALNGIVFVLLGTQLPNAMRNTWDDIAIGNGMLVLFVLGLTLVLFAVRFVWVLVMEYFFVKRKKKRSFHKADAKAALITTLCGAKGTITLAVLFTIPTFVSTGVRFPQRDLIIFLACGVILCTLLAATYLVPLLAPKDKQATDAESREKELACSIEIIRNVIEDLNDHRTPENRSETRKVIKAYADRLARIKDKNDIPEQANTALRLKALEWEADKTIELMKSSKVSHEIGFEYLARLEHVGSLLRHSRGKLSPHRLLIITRTKLRHARFAIIRQLPNFDLTAHSAETRKLHLATYTYAIEKLEETIASNEVPTEEAAAVLLEYQRNILSIKDERITITTQFKVANRADDVKRFAYQKELEQIQAMYDDERISRACAKRMRENVYLMQLDLEDEI